MKQIKSRYPGFFIFSDRASLISDFTCINEPAIPTCDLYL